MGAAAAVCLLAGQGLYGYEIFIYRPLKEKNPLFVEKRLVLHGEFFGHLLLPGRFPSYNDLTGPEDRWNYGFRNRIYLTENFSFLAQLITHDDGEKRTKFDWHFSFRYTPLEHLVLILGHDSNHDSDYQSFVGGKAFYLNRNYAGFGLPFRKGGVYFEPFTWFLYHTNHRGHLDLSGENLVQEYGIRIGAWIGERLGLSLQALGQSEALFALGQSWRLDLICRLRVIDHVECSWGISLWQDIQESRMGNKKAFSSIHWGLAIPF